MILRLNVLKHNVNRCLILPEWVVSKSFFFLAQKRCNRCFDSTAGMLNNIKCQFYCVFELLRNDIRLFLGNNA